MRKFRTGVYRLDDRLGGGLTSGLLEIWGGESAGKSTLALSFMSEAYEVGLPTGIIHLDGAPDPIHIYNAGPADCLVSAPENGEQAIDAGYYMLKHGVKVLVIDTLVGLVPSMDLEGPLTARFTPTQRRLVHHGLTVLREMAKSRGALVIAVNQLRETIGDGQQSYLYKTTKLLSDHRFMLWKKSARTSFGKLEKIVSHVEVEYVRRFQDDLEMDFSIWPECGIRPENEILYYLWEQGVMERKGNWWSSPLSEKNLGPGFAEAAKIIGQYFTDYYRLMVETMEQTNGTS